jgi:hypothetical protein
MNHEELAGLIDAYRDGTLGPDEAARLAEAIRAGGETADRIRRELEMAGRLGQVFDGADDAAFLRSFQERMRAENGKSQFIRAFEAKREAGGPGRTRRVPRLARRAFEPSSPAPWIGVAAAVMLAVGLLLLLGRSSRRPTPAVRPPVEEAAVKPVPDTSGSPDGRRPVIVESPKGPGKTAGTPETPDAPPSPEPAVARGPVEGPGPIPPAEEPPAVRPEPVAPDPVPDMVRVPEPPVAPKPPIAPRPDAPLSSDAVKTVAKPRTEAQASVAILERFRGKVVVLGEKGEAPAKARQPLRPAQTVQVIGLGAAEIRFPDGTRVEVQRDAAVAFPAADGATARLEVIEGRILAEVARQPAGKPFVFASAEADAVVLGTRLALTVIPGLTRLDVYQGKVRLDRRSRDESVAVTAGQHAIATKGRALKALGPFTAVPRRPVTSAVTSFTLINADTNRPIAGYTPMVDGAVIHLDRLPTRNLNIRADTLPAEVGSVKFVFDGKPHKSAEWRVPYALHGDSIKGDYSAWTPPAGEHVLTATPYEKPNAKGDAGQSHTITFYVIGGAR